jgi:hypothetical protein
MDHRFNDSSAITSFAAVIRSAKLAFELYGNSVTTDFCSFRRWGNSKAKSCRIASYGASYLIRSLRTPKISMT